MAGLGKYGIGIFMELVGSLGLDLHRVPYAGTMSYAAYLRISGAHKPVTCPIGLALALIGLAYCSPSCVDA